MLYHEWELTTRAGVIFTGTDDYPKPELKAECAQFKLWVPGKLFPIKIVVPEGEMLVFSRTVRVETGRSEQTKPHHWSNYNLGYGTEIQTVKMRLGKHTGKDTD